MKAAKNLLLVCVVCFISLLALGAEEDAVFVRVLDVGPALCCVVKMPGEQYMIFDAGYWKGKETFASVAEFIPKDEEIDLLVLSHSDSDHIGVVPQICASYTVKKVLRGGRSSTDTWKNARKEIRREVKKEGCEDIYLGKVECPPGTEFQFGDVTVTVVSGFHKPPSGWGKLSPSERKNAGSVAVRLQYKKRAILFCGDHVGRHLGQPAGECIAAERFMVERASVTPLRADVLIAPHHGADNASSEKFIRAVAPKYVVVSAGHDYDHPSRSAMQRYLDFGVPLEKIFRTDLGDDESPDGDWEWDYGRIAGHEDKPGDDDVDIVLPAKGAIRVNYRKAE